MQPSEHDAKGGSVQLATRLREIRELKGMTQEQVAIDLGVSEGTYRHWEAGRVVPLMDETPKVAKALGVTVSELFHGMVAVKFSDDDDMATKELYEMLAAKLRELPLPKRGCAVEVIDALIVEHRHQTSMASKARGGRKRVVALN
jgi:transcriptional regulator with XRE-family HTH domain